jgi:hypothetical protein
MGKVSEDLQLDQEELDCEHGECRAVDIGRERRLHHRQLLTKGAD